MNPVEFKDCLAELSSYFGEKAYAPRMVGMIEGIVRPLTKSECMQVIETLAQTHHKAPTPAMIKQAALPFLHRANEREKQARIAELGKGATCRYCANSGVIMALLKKDPRLEYSFGCPKCQAYEARRLRHPPMWDDARKADFIPLSFQSGSHEAGMTLREETFQKHVKPKPKTKHPADIRNMLENFAQKFGLPRGED